MFSLFYVTALVSFTAEEAGQPSCDNFLPIRFFAQHANGGILQKREWWQ